MSYQLVDPSSRLDFAFDWTDWLAAGDSISSRLWTIDPSTGSPETPSLTNATSAIVIVEGFEAGEVYRLTEHIVTADGLEEDRTITLRCENR